MFNEDRSICISYNGEVYNYKDLRESLISRGHRFRSQTDSEVILHGFEEFGPDVVERINGMFAFAIWDSKSRDLYLFRDRLGIKPLYYYSDDTKLVFASEIKAILKAGIAPALEPSSVSSFLSLRYTPGENTMFRSIKKLPAGTFLRVKPEGQVEKVIYWSLLDQRAIEPYSEKQAQQRFYELLNDAVHCRLAADVPVGAFLSGGVDSSAVTALMRIYQEDIETFTFGFNTDIDERDRAKHVAEHIGVKNTATSLGKNDFQYCSRAIWHLEEPLGDSIIIPTYLLAQAAARKVKVVQLGEGADEILGGYVHQLTMTYGDVLRDWLPRGIRLRLGGLAGKLPQVFWENIFPYPAKLGRSGVAKVLDYLRSLDSPCDAYFSLASVFTEKEKTALTNSDFHDTFMKENTGHNLFTHYWNQLKNPVFQNRLLQVDLKFWTTDYTMLRMDKLTMAHSLEARVPFLDHRLVELCLRLPRRYKTRNFEQKYLMRRALKGRNLLPSSVLNAKKKSFFLPIEKCFDQRFHEFVHDNLNDDSVKRRGLFDAGYVRKLRDDPERELAGNKQLMLLLVFEIWCKIFLDQKGELPVL